MLKYPIKISYFYEYLVNLNLILIFLIIIQLKENYIWI